MRFGGRRTSRNVESQSGGGGFGRGGGLGGGGAMLLGFVFSRFGIGGVVVLFLIMLVIGGNPLGLLGGGGSQQSVAPNSQAGAQNPEQICASDETKRFLCQVLASTEEHWTGMFQANGSTYSPPRLVFYPGSGQSGCGAAQSAMGPFYCPSDRGIYLDTSFFDQLDRQLGAPGDFAQAYVIAHEVGHHVQTVTGVASSIRQAQSRVSQAQGNALQVRMELQADCYAGVWASREQAAMEPGDLEEGMNAAAAIGDDRLQGAQGRVAPESFTHGTSAQRQEALLRGYRGGEPGACEAYTTGI